MLQSEYQNVYSRHVDTDLALDDEALVEQIRCECLVREESGPEFCYRNGFRHVAYLDEIDHAAAATAELDKALSAFPEDGVLWITGGTQGLGGLCAQHFLRRHGVRRVVLSGRTVLPSRDRWSAHRREDTDVARKIRLIEALEAEGAQVRVCAVAMSDLEAMRKEVDEIQRTLGPITGVVHCAGTIDLETPAFIHKSVTQIQAVLTPKVLGLENLIRCTEELPLQFMILFSSISSVVPALAVGQSDYALANSYMDYIAEAHHGRLPITSIQWSSWKESGIGEAKSKSFQDAGLLSQLDTEGLEFLDRVLADRLGPVVLPAIVDVSRWQSDRLTMRYVRPAGSKGTELRRAEAHPAPTHLLASAIVGWLRSTVSTALRIDESKLDDDTQLQDYGVDSIFMLQLLKPVSQLTGSAVDPSILFEYPTIRSFAGWLASTYPDAFASTVGDQPVQPAPVDTDAGTPQPLPQENSSTLADRPAEDIAVVGMACRFPGARNLDAYWRLLAEGRSAIGRVPAERGQTQEGSYAALLDDVTHFDSKFFQIQDSDASVIDPQALLLLEETLHALCHAGLSLHEVKGSHIGVYLGGRSKHRPDPDSLAEALNPILAVGQNYLAANISRFFDLRGPSVVVDTACSSALVAMQMAIQALRSGDISAALVGGVSLLNTDTDLALFEQRGLQLKEPHFHIFDRRSGGAIYAEGAGMVLLKAAAQARRDRDTIYAVIKGIAVNNDGRTVGPSAPNMQAQKDVMHAALEKSGLQPQEIEYVEVNGSGSEIPDLLELKATQAVYRPAGSAVCELGSMKPNIGHPLCAAGIASFIKVVLMLHERKRVPFLSAEQPSVHYSFESSPFRFCRSLQPWENARASAAVSCFADGGTNVHVVLQAWPEESPAELLRRPIAPPLLERVDIRHFKRHEAFSRENTVAEVLDSAPARRGHEQHECTATADRSCTELGFWKRINSPDADSETSPASIWKKVVANGALDAKRERRLGRDAASPLADEEQSPHGAELVH
jgi:3-oxoacyl-(acyl-carrier-protein) synthase/aryl carrier-like protein